MKNKIKCSEALLLLTVAYCNATLVRSNVNRWFPDDRKNVNDEEFVGRSSTSTRDENIDDVKKVVLVSRLITVGKVAEGLNKSIGSCHSIFANDFGIRRLASKLVPKLLRFDQKQLHINIAKELLDSVRLHKFAPEAQKTREYGIWYVYSTIIPMELLHESRPEKGRQVRSNVKVLLTLFLDCRRIVHYHMVERLVRNIICKLCVICAKQSAHNVRISG